jgi:uncharacterized protein (DUF1778 family)
MGARSSKLSHSLTVRLDSQDRTHLSQAAQLRQTSVSGYVRAVAVSQAVRELEAAQRQCIAMTAAEQTAFWRALNAAPKLTAAQRRLASTMRGTG